eukprot:jgi/Mesen1/2443/ME000158S01645
MDANEQATFRAGLAELLQDYVGKESVRAALGLPQKPWLAKRRRVLAGAGKGQELVPAQQQLTQRYIKLLSISDDDVRAPCPPHPQSRLYALSSLHPQSLIGCTLSPPTAHPGTLTSSSSTSPSSSSLLLHGSLAPSRRAGRHTRPRS